MFNDPVCYDSLPANFAAFCLEVVCRQFRSLKHAWIMTRPPCLVGPGDWCNPGKCGHGHGLAAMALVDVLRYLPGHSRQIRGDRKSVVEPAAGIRQHADPLLASGTTS